MNRILQYLKNNPKTGTYALLVISLIFGLFLSIYCNFEMRKIIPHAQEITDQILPLKIEHQTIVYPNIIKIIPIFSHFSDFKFQIGINTIDDFLETDYLPSGIYLSKNALYTIIDEQVSVTALTEKLFLPKGDYSKDFCQYINYVSLLIFLITFIMFIIINFIIALAYSGLSYFFTSSLKIHPSFSLRLCISNIIIPITFVLTIILMYFDIYVKDWLIFGLIVILHTYYLNKISKE